MEIGELNWLDEVVVETSGFSLLAIFVGTPAGEGDEGDVAAFRGLAQMLGDFVAVHSWHADVEEYDFWKEPLEFLDRILAAVGGLDFMSDELHHGSEHGRDVPIVVDDQDALGQWSRFCGRIAIARCGLWR